jgi:7-cyano-7-deazaguanine synthase
MSRPEFAYTVDYGQAAAAGEIRAASAVADAVQAEHRVIRADCSSLGSGDMAGMAASALAPIPEWWPFRNQLLVTLVGMRAIADGVGELLLASVASDGKHADGRADFFRAMDAVMALQEGAIRITAPAHGLTTVQLVRNSGIPQDILAWSHSCHVSEYACGRCRGCTKHAAVMKELGYGDY